ncbi:MAG: outer membrane beta-barrel protein [Elusimicrobia bacterium]|nr:outer membrane beta-barrel protein [Elusimicrobiota bacterium]
MKINLREEEGGGFCRSFLLCHGRDLPTFSRFGFGRIFRGGSLRNGESSHALEHGFRSQFSQGTGPTADLLDGGFGLDFFGGYHQPDRLLGFRMDLMFHNFKLSDAALAQLDNADEGGLRVLGGGPSLVISPPVGKRVRPSLYAGPGFYYEDASVTWDESCSPIYGCNSGDYTSGNMTTTRLGWQGGVGLDFLFDGGLGAISFNVQYVTINNTHADIEFIPINIGYKVGF